MVGIISLFSAGLIVFAAVFYVQEIMGNPIDLSGLIGYLNAVIVLGMYAGIGICVGWVRPDRSVLHLVLAAVPVALVYAAFALLAPSAPAITAWGRNHGDLVVLLSVGSASVYLGYCGWLLRRGGLTVATESVRFLVAWLGRLLLGYAVIAVATTGGIVIVDLDLEPTVALNFLLFLGWNVLAILSFLRYLSHPVDIFAEGEVPADARRRYGISERELDVIALVSRGLSNKEIADKLGVSYTTVRTHLYNVFKKTGAASRVELLRILSAR
jgi:DNA-binding CsgD family transcriptional regulator